MPLRVAYGVTCHKTQGLSLDRVQVVYHSQFWSQVGMIYVALSRCRTPGGLRLVGTADQLRARINTNPKLARWA
jgi:ATP-dependent exoDNAse (exonuclease V) alpha subunit